CCARAGKNGRSTLRPYVAGRIVNVGAQPAAPVLGRTGAAGCAPTSRRSPIDRGRGRAAARRAALGSDTMTHPRSSTRMAWPALLSLTALVTCPAARADDGDDPQALIARLADPAQASAARDELEEDLERVTPALLEALDDPALRVDPPGEGEPGIV